MNKFWKIVLTLLGFVLLAFAIAFVTGSFRPKQAGIQIETTPAAMVFINGVQVGKTPYEATQKPGEINLKLVPVAGEKPLVGFETRVLLSAGIKTVVKRDFGENESASSGEIVSFERTGEAEASLAVVSDPDSAQVSIDGTPRGFAPYKTSSIGKGTHQIVVSAPDYAERTMTVNTLTGYKLTAIIKLAASGITSGTGAAPSPTPSSAPAARIMVMILPTPSGFLRVRAEPNTDSKELARVKPGEKYLLVEKDAKTGWFKIEFLTGQSGWISNQYAQIETPP